MLLFTIAVLAIDARFPSPFVQAALGASATVLLLLVARASDRVERRRMWICVAYSTAIEIFATQVWGLYGYALGNVPLYVPPGHGLIFLAALQLSRTPAIARRADVLVRVVLAVAATWSVAALVLRHDVHGALYLPFYARFARSREGAPFAATFVITSIIELLGVRLGNWHWAPVMPGLGIPSGDPPSLIAGGYCSFALVAVLLDGLLFRARRVTSTP